MAELALGQLSLFITCFAELALGLLSLFITSFAELALGQLSLVITCSALLSPPLLSWLWANSAFLLPALLSWLLGGSRQPMSRDLGAVGGQPQGWVWFAGARVPATADNSEAARAALGRFPKLTALKMVN